MKLEKLLTILAASVMLMGITPMYAGAKNVKKKARTTATTTKRTAKPRVVKVALNADDNSEYIKFLNNGSISMWGWEDGSYVDDCDVCIVITGHGRPIIIDNGIAYDVNSMENCPEALEFGLASSMGDILANPLLIKNILSYDPSSKTLNYKTGMGSGSINLSQVPEDSRTRIRWTDK